MPLDMESNMIKEKKLIVGKLLQIKVKIALGFKSSVKYNYSFNTNWR